MKRMKCCIRMGMRVVGLGFSSKTLLTSAKQKQNFAIVSKKEKKILLTSAKKDKMLLTSAKLKQNFVIFCQKDKICYHQQKRK